LGIFLLSMSLASYKFNVHQLIQPFVNSYALLLRNIIVGQLTPRIVMLKKQGMSKMLGGFCATLSKIRSPIFTMKRTYQL
jgi:hypothetical protein